jgi:DNA-binding response OmpR family regulator
VEDDNDLRRMYRLALSLAGYDVIEANSGYAALQRLDANRPDLIVLDLLLPGYDGLTVHREIAAQAHSRQVPIVVVTGSDIDVSELPVARKLRKPVGEAVLVQTVRDCLSVPRET